MLWGACLHEGEHLVGAKGAVEADADGLGVLHRDVEGLCSLGVTEGGDTVAVFELA